MYKIVRDTNYFKLQENISKMMNDGWKPQGGLLISYEENVKYFYQAIIK